jgi:hypothetical protein
VFVVVTEDEAENAGTILSSLLVSDGKKTGAHLLARGRGAALFSTAQ